MSFVVFALPRSRTAWLSRFLTYGEWTCDHEEILHLRSMDDIRSWFQLPNKGTCETAAGSWWRTVLKHDPAVRVVVIRRPVADVVNSLMAVPGTSFDRDLLTRAIRRADRKLDQIERRMPNVLSVRFEELCSEARCAEIFEHCLPYKHNHIHWELLSRVNIQINLPAMLRYMHAHGPQLTKLAGIAKWHELNEFAKRPAIEAHDITITEERFDEVYPDLLSQRVSWAHEVSVDEPPDYHHTEQNVALFRQLDSVGKLQCMVARSNGRVFGYLMTCIGPGFGIAANKTVSEHLWFYASPHFPGLGRRLQIAAKEALRTRGVDELYLRAGTRGDGPRLGALYRRMGAEPSGQMFRIHLKE